MQETVKYDPKSWAYWNLEPEQEAWIRDLAFIQLLTKGVKPTPETISQEAMTILQTNKGRQVGTVAAESLVEALVGEISPGKTISRVVLAKLGDQDVMAKVWKVEGYAGNVNDPPEPDEYHCQWAYVVDAGGEPVEQLDPASLDQTWLQDNFGPDETEEEDMPESRQSGEIKDKIGRARRHLSRARNLEAQTADQIKDMVADLLRLAPHHEDELLPAGAEAQRLQRRLRGT